MAHFAKLGIDNVVLRVAVVDNIRSMTVGGIEREDIGIEYLRETHGHENWVKCSRNTQLGQHVDPETRLPDGGTALRGNYPSVGWFYNSEHDIFHPPRPFASHTLNTTTGMWDPPIPKPELTAEQEATPGAGYYWDEDAYQADNTQGWVYIVRTTPEQPVPE